MGAASRPPVRPGMISCERDGGDARQPRDDQTRRAQGALRARSGRVQGAREQANGGAAPRADQRAEPRRGAVSRVAGAACLAARATAPRRGTRQCVARGAPR
eukprot:793785-Prymnesium_polylepis.1